MSKKKNKLQAAIAADTLDDVKPEVLYSRKIGKRKVRVVLCKYSMVDLEVLGEDALGKKGWREVAKHEARSLLLDLLAEVYDDD